MPSLDIDALTPTNTKSALTLVKTLPSPPHITNGHIVRHAQAVRNSRKVAMPPATSVRPPLRLRTLLSSLGNRRAWGAA